MGMLGEMFPGRKLQDTGGEDGDGKVHRPRFDIDLDSGVVRLPDLRARTSPPADSDPAPDPDAQTDPGA